MIILISVTSRTMRRYKQAASCHAAGQQLGLMILPLGLARVKYPESHFGTLLMCDVRREKQRILLLWAENTSNTAVFTILLMTVSCLRKMDSREYIAFPGP